MVVSMLLNTMMRFVRLFAVVCLVLAVFPIYSMAQDYRVGEADVLQITVYEHEDLTTTVRVSGDGRITFPLLGQLKVIDLTVTQIAEKLEKELADGYIVNPQVNVFIEDFRSRVYYVTGEVEKPDAYKYEGETTVLRAITIAGGFTEVASKSKVKIVRKENNKEKIIKRARMDEIVLPNDVIVVPESFF